MKIVDERDNAEEFVSLRCEAAAHIKAGDVVQGWDHNFYLVCHADKIGRPSRVASFCEPGYKGLIHLASGEAVVWENEFVKVRKVKAYLVVGGAEK